MRPEIHVRSEAVILLGDFSALFQQVGSRRNPSGLRFALVLPLVRTDQPDLRDALQKYFWRRISHADSPAVGTARHRQARAATCSGARPAELIALDLPRGRRTASGSVRSGQPKIGTMQLQRLQPLRDRADGAAVSGGGRKGQSRRLAYFGLWFDPGRLFISAAPGIAPLSRETLVGAIRN